MRPVRSSRTLLRRRLTATSTTVGLLAAVLSVAAVPGDAPANPADCTDDTAVHAGTVTAPEVFAPGFPQRRILTSEINGYVDAVTSQSDRIRSGTLATSWGGNELVYSLVTSPENHERLEDIVEGNRLLREPRLVDEDEARDIASELPAIVWYQGNVHGAETSGADAAVSLLHDLADRTDCTVTAMLESLVIGIVPTQNPDGRDGARRQNAYAFDMNRDWFAATQPETRGKLALLADYPPVLFVDAHEMGSSSFFFPPNADPIHHEISDEALGWIDELYAPAIREQFEQRRETAPTEWDYFNYDTYDLFYMGYGDSVPTTAYGAAGMTYEKGTADPDQQKHDEQYVAGWTSLLAAAQHRERILFELWQGYDKALADGEAGRLEPNLVVEPKNEVTHEVPDETIRNYFLTTDRGEADVRRLVSRLMGFDVEVRRLTEDVTLSEGRRPGQQAAEVVVPSGSWWIPMAQPQKRWIQALLGEDPFVPFDYFYDVSSWSNPQLMNLDVVFTGESVAPSFDPVDVAPGLELGGRTDGSALWWPGDTGQDVALAMAAAEAGVVVHRLMLPNQFDGVEVPAGAFVATAPDGADPVTTLLGLVNEARTEFGHLNVMVRATTAAVPGDAREFFAPRIALFEPATAGGPLPSEPFGHLSWLLEQHWNLDVDRVTAAQIAAGQLTTGGYDELVVGGVQTVELDPLAPIIDEFVRAGGTYVGLARGGTGGTAYAVANGWTSSDFTSSAGTAGGTTFRIDVDPGAGAVALGADEVGYWFNLPDWVLAPTSTGRTVATYPPADEMFFAGFAAGEDAWAGSAVVVEEALGEGHVVLFSGDPAFRGLTDGPAFLLANALASPATPMPGLLRDVTGTDAPRLDEPYGWGRPLVVEVLPAQAAVTRRVLADLGAGPDVRVVTSTRGTVRFTIPNPMGLDAEAHPFSWRIRPALERHGIRPVVAFL